MVSVTTTLTTTTPERRRRENESHVPSDERIYPPRTPITSTPPKLKVVNMAKTFRPLIDDIDNGLVIFSDDLEAAQFPPQITQPGLNKYSVWQGKSRDGNNLLHYAVKEEIMTEEQGEAAYQAVSYRISFVKWLLKSDPDMFMDKNKNEEQPLSYVLAKYPVGEDVTSRPTTSTDPGLQSALTHYFLSEETLKDQCIEILNAEDKGQSRRTPSAESKTDSEFRCTVLHMMIKNMGVEIIPYLQRNLFNQRSLTSKDKDGNMPLHVALDVQHWKPWEKAEDRAKLIALLIKLEDSALTQKNGTTMVKDNLRTSPYAYHMARCVELHTKENGKGCTGQACKDVEFILKDALINLPEEQDGMKHIVRKPGTQAPYHYFDLRELSCAKLSPTDFLSNIEACIGNLCLDAILKYVYLPKPSSLSEKCEDYPGDYVDYTDVFELLRKNNVRRIIELTVVDDEDLPHSDETIKLALSEIEVRIWNWIQYDLSCKTISKAAPDVEELFLYSTGNRAVLQNWTSHEGLGRLRKLKKVTFKIDPKAKRGEDKYDYEKKLKSRIMKLGLEKLKDVVVIVNPSSSSSPDTTADGAVGITNPEASDGNQPDAWLACMDRFSEYIQELPESILDRAGEPVVKIAIIDDGLDVHHSRLRGVKITGGTSFHTRGALGSPAASTHHFPSTSGHGTEMTMRVRQIFPMATLYIVRLDVLRGEGGHATIAAGSAAKAIMWAVEEGVDIISMSWTIEESPRNGSDIDIKRMKDAVFEASKKNILMFCAARDGGWAQNSVSLGYPKNCPTPTFCIGAATEHGEISPRVGSQKSKIDYAFPGENMEPLSGASGTIIAGSSIATALATGLAGLLLYLVEFERPTRTKDEEELRKCGRAWRKHLQDHQKMQCILDAMGTNPQKYIPVLKYFNIDQKNREWGNNAADHAFYDLVDKIRKEIQSEPPKKN